MITIKEKNVKRRNRYKNDPVYRQKILDMNQQYRIKPSSRIKRAKRDNAKFKGIRILLINQLGGECVTCGFPIMDALQIDHKNGDGHNDRKKFKNRKSNYSFYLNNLIIAKKKLQVLCANCNKIKQIQNDEYVRKYPKTDAIVLTKLEDQKLG